MRKCISRIEILAGKCKVHQKTRIIQLAIGLTTFDKQTSDSMQTIKMHANDTRNISAAIGSGECEFCLDSANFCHSRRVWLNAGIAMSARDF